jgi:hypothetical protein
MSFFSKATAAPIPKTRNAWLAGLMLAGFFVIMVVGQLFTFEDFPGVMMAMGLPAGETLAALYAGIVVTLEVLALPFLLGLRLSVAMRVVSMVVGWLVVGVWLGISLLVNLNSAGGDSGLLGATVPLPAGWWSVWFCLALGILAVWAAWGMWLFGHSKKK